MVSHVSRVTGQFSCNFSFDEEDDQEEEFAVNGTCDEWTSLFETFII